MRAKAGELAIRANPNDHERDLKMENLEVVRPTWLAGSVFGCLLRDKIVERVLAGDEAAFAFAHSDAASGFPAFSGAASATAKYGS